MKRGGLQRSGLKSHRKPINKIGRLTKVWIARRIEWVEDHPPDANGMYNCHICVYFGAPEGLCKVHIDAFQLDHIVPRGSGGGDEDANLGPSHGDCNYLKGSQLLWQMKRSAKM